MNDDSLSAFIRAAKARDIDDASLVSFLRQQGWQEQRIYRLDARESPAWTGDVH